MRNNTRSALLRLTKANMSTMADVFLDLTQQIIQRCVIRRIQYLKYVFNNWRISHNRKCWNSLHRWMIFTCFPVLWDESHQYLIRSDKLYQYEINFLSVSDTARVCKTLRLNLPSVVIYSVCVYSFWMVPVLICRFVSVIGIHCLWWL